MKRAACLLACVLAAGPVWAINKCTDASGKVAFQDAPCAGKGEKIEVHPASGPARAADAGEAQARVDQLKRDNQMSEAIRTHEPLVGMTAKQLQEAMGTPTKVNANNYNGTRQDQVIYERANETWLVYTRNGLVESIQYRPGQPVGSPPARSAGACPSQHEIKDAITSASSMTLSDGERAERWKHIRAMQSCER